MLSYIVIFIIKNIIAFITIAEPVNKYLVHNSTLCPCRCLKTWCNLKIVIWIKVFNCPNLVVVTHRPAKFNLEIVIYLICSNINLRFIIIKHALRLHSCHNMFNIINNKICFIYIVSARTQSDSYLIPRHRLSRTSIAFRNIRKQRSWMKCWSCTAHIKKSFFPGS